MVEKYKPIYTVKEASEVLRMNKTDVYKLMDSKKLAYVILGSKKVRGTDLEKFINGLPAGEGKTKEA